MAWNFRLSFCLFNVIGLASISQTSGRGRWLRYRASEIKNDEFVLTEIEITNANHV